MTALTTVWIGIVSIVSWLTAFFGMLSDNFSTFIFGILFGVIATIIIIFFQERSMFMQRRNYIKSIIWVLNEIITFLSRKKKHNKDSFDTVKRKVMTDALDVFKKKYQALFGFSNDNQALMLCHIVNAERFLSGKSGTNHRKKLIEMAEAMNFFVKALIDYANFIVDHHEFGSKFKALFYSHPVTYQDDLLVFFEWDEKLKKLSMDFADEPRGQQQFRRANKKAFDKNRQKIKTKQVKLFIVK